MATAFTNLSQWWWGEKKKEAEVNSREVDIVKFPLVKVADQGSSSRRFKRKWQSREQRKIDKEYDVVVVPSDGECISGSDSDSDWSIGWLEPHGPGFQSDSETDASFAVLVPCYGRGHRDMVGPAKNNILTAIEGIPDSFSPESKKFMEQWLTSLQPS